MGKMVLILGGARSGKSSLAERMAEQAGPKVTFLATAQALDEEMRQRIAAHKASRPREWRTVEEPLELAAAVESAVKESDTVLVDCLTVWVSNHLCRMEAVESTPEWHRELEMLGQRLRDQASRIATAAACGGATLLLVSNEVGLGLVPDNPLGRAYRDLLGAINRQMAAEAEQVLLLVAGIPLDVKRLALEMP
ncbi:MAG TPA: bifunctional adenosylcobinamide kinase/adenosylcobinamide-phosphate guanylyltransferase [Chloroflexota bacterium]|nr:bifunctional adenosylcobinamide kinase/adenosylcobinamide-phosphate guanylyltransferase [Chloroflexota bacterium]